MKVVQDRLNHSSESVTSEIHTHVRATAEMRPKEWRR